MHFITKKFGTFKNLQKIGQGGQSDIYIGYLDFKNNEMRPLVFKKFKETRYSNNELNMLKKLGYHKNIIKLIDTGIIMNEKLEQMQGNLLVYKYYNKGDGMNFTDDNHSINIYDTCKEVDKHIAPLWEAIAYAHSKGITHRDIKPENILIHRTNKDKLSVVLTDWAFSSNSNKLFGVRGSISYIAPEIRNGKPRDQHTSKCDIWSAGATWLSMCYSNTILQYNDGDKIRQKGYKFIKQRHGYVWNNFSNKTQKILEASLVVNPKDRADADEIVAIAQA